MSKVPERLINFRVYNSGNDLLGIADVTLPSVQALTETVKGAGIAGEIDSPTRGHYGSMECTINWRTLEQAAVELAEPTVHALDLRGSQQVYDSGSATYTTVPVKLVLRAAPKQVDLGKFEVSAATDTSTVLECTYLKLTIDGTDLVEIDKYNFICTINGTDYMESVREDLGIM